MINPRNIARGTIWFVDLDPVVGHEQAKRRPCLVISADLFNQSDRGLAIILPLTSRKHDIYWSIPLPTMGTKLKKDSYVLCNQIRAVSLERFSPQCLGMVDEYALGLVEKQLSVILQLIP